MSGTAEGTKIFDAKSSSGSIETGTRVKLLPNTPAHTEVTEERAVVEVAPPPLAALGVGVVEVADSSSSSSISGNRGGK